MGVGYLSFPHGINSIVDKVGVNLPVSGNNSNTGRRGCSSVSNIRDNMDKVETHLPFSGSVAYIGSLIISPIQTRWG